jgi:peptide/nickel transport system permease protein
VLRGYLIKRIITSFFILWVVVTLNFVMFRVVHPIKDPSALILNPEWPVEVRLKLQELWGINEPLFPNQYLRYLWNMLTWQYGLSFDTPPKDISKEMGWRLANTLILLGTVTVITIIIGTYLGVLAGSRRGKKTDVTVMGIGLFTWGFPTFFFQILFLIFFAYYTRINWGIQIIPFGGMVSYPPPQDPLAYLGDVLWHAAGPIITLTVLGFGGWALYTRNLMIDALTEDFILTAKAKGAKERDVLYKHAFRAILPPIATMIAMSIPGIVTGAVITETIFSWPGIGSWYIDALNRGNHPVTQSVLYNYAFLVILANLVSDILYGFLDPRIRVGVRR